MDVLYGILAAISLGLFAFGVATRQKRDCLMMLASVFCAELGFFLISVSQTLSAALWANRLCYLGQVFLPFFLLMMIARLSGVRLPAWAPKALPAISLAVLFITMTPGWLPWYYKSADIAVAGGVTHIVREYGPLRRLYFIYLLGYLAADTAVLALAIRGRRMRLPQQSLLLVGAVYIQIAIWLAEQFLPRGFEYLSASYVVSEIFILLVDSMLRTVDQLHLGELEAAMGQLETARSELAALQADMDAQRDAPQPFNSQELAARIEALEAEYSLTRREGEVLRLLVEGKSRNEAAVELCVSEETVKKHISSLYRKLDVHSRAELFRKLGGQ